jgi:hypothetical protein
MKASSTRRRKRRRKAAPFRSCSTRRSRWMRGSIRPLDQLGKLPNKPEHNESSPNQQSRRRMGIGGTRHSRAKCRAGPREGGGVRHLSQRHDGQRRPVAGTPVSPRAGPRSRGADRCGRQRGHRVDKRPARRRGLAWRTLLPVRTMPARRFRHVRESQDHGGSISTAGMPNI